MQQIVVVQEQLTFGKWENFWEKVVHLLCSVIWGKNAYGSRENKDTILQHMNTSIDKRLNIRAHAKSPHRK